jgi:hypothetical protein
MRLSAAVALSLFCRRQNQAQGTCSPWIHLRQPEYVLILDYCFNGIRVFLVQKECGDGNVRAGAVVGHNRFSHFALGSIRVNTGIMIAEASIVGNQDGRSPSMLSMPHLLYKGTITAIDQQDKGLEPGVLLSGDSIDLPRRISLRTTYLDFDKHHHQNNIIAAESNLRMVASRTGRPYVDIPPC